ncbi:hypothetical protein [Streptomyces sp. TR06-5]|uniref:hypothetical protein n=1 Tax=Streptomyces sp. TR06-5 TaxID=3385976 RepID=UPI0039A3A678
MQLMKDLSLSRRDGSRKAKTGATYSGKQSTGSAVEWELCLPGRPTLTIHDNRWDIGERDLVLFRPTVVPEMPAALSDVQNRLRSGIAESPDREELRLMVYPTYVDERGRPRIKKSFTEPDLADYVKMRHFDRLPRRQGVTLEVPPDLRGLHYALFFPPDDDETPVVAFVHFRIVPVLHHIGWLSRDEN